MTRVVNPLPIMCYPKSGELRPNFNGSGFIYAGFNAAAAPDSDVNVPRAIDTARSRVEAALHSERENVNAALEAAGDKARKQEQRIKTLEGALQTIHRLAGNDAGIRQVAKLALESAV